MRRLASFLIASLAMTAAAAEAAPRLNGEEKLARALEGRIAGEPVDCISLRNVRSSRVIDRTAIIYDAGGTLYVNRPRAGAESLNNWNTLVTRTFSDRLCSIDTVNLVDMPSSFYRGTVFLGEFVPYRKARR